MSTHTENLWQLSMAIVNAPTPQHAIRLVAGYLYQQYSVEHFAWIDTRTPDFYKFEKGELAWADQEICMSSSLKEPIRNIDASQEGFSAMEERLAAKAKAYDIFPLLPEVMLIIAIQEPISFLDSADWKTIVTLLTDCIKKSENHSQKYHIANHRYKTILDSISDGLVVIDLENKIQFFNQEMELMSGYASQEIIGLNAYKALTAPKHQKILATETSNLDVEEEASFAGQLKKKNGELLWVQIKRTPYKDFNDNIIGYIGTIKDLTEQNRIHQLVKENEKRLNHIITTALDGFILIDDQLIVQEWNEQASEIFGYTKKETLGQSLKKLVVPQHLQEAYFLGIQYFLDTKDSSILNQRIETIAQRKDGSEFPIELSFSPLETNDQFHFFAFARDITQRRQHENELLIAKQAAEKAQTAERQFLTHMSHEIRTPMNAVIGMTHLLLGTNPTNEQIEYLSALKFSADSLVSLISNVLDLSKIEAQELEFDSQQFSLRQLINGVSQAFRIKMQDTRVAVHLDYDNKIQHQIIGDYTRLNQILTNLLGNASKFTTKGSITLSTKLINTINDQYTIKMSIIDTGIGIAEEHLHDIFKNFKQANAEIHGKFGGTGLGLAIVKQLVETQGGQIDVQSRLNKGTTFSFELTFDTAPEIDNPQATNIGQTIPTEDFSHIRVLVVEDNLTNQKLIAKILEFWSCHYIIANNGKEALEVIRRKPFDLVLMDLHMPEMDGYTTTTKIRGLTTSQNSEIPIIALTAAALSDEKSRVFEVGMNEFLTKPFSPKQLRDLFTKYVSIKPNKIIDVQLPTKKTKTAMKIDLSYLRELSGDDNEFIADILSTFLEENPKDIASTQEAMQNKDIPQIGKLAHKMKSSFQMLGIEDVRLLAFNIEQGAKKEEASFEEISAWTTDLIQMAQAIYPEVEAQIAAL
ncbi:MAG: PAS domain S-box protein [Aureispira sp.]|nr:PAS domain S-box protein [Aureispira sp.]